MMEVAARQSGQVGNKDATLLSRVVLSVCGYVRLGRQDGSPKK
jgi:hypothetical protein